MALTGDEITLTLCMMEQQEEVTLPAHLRVTPSPFLFAGARRSRPGLRASSCRKLCEAQFDRFRPGRYGAWYASSAPAASMVVRALSRVWARRLSTTTDIFGLERSPRAWLQVSDEAAPFIAQSNHEGCDEPIQPQAGRNLTASNVTSGRRPCDRAWPRRSVAALKAWFATVLSNSQQTWRSPK